MFEWTSSGWLWGMAAILVPIAIHLISRGRSPRLLLGSTRFLAASSSRSARRLRLTEPVLLALRCLALALLTLILAEPVRWRPVTGGAAGRLVIDPALIGRTEPSEALGRLVAERRAVGWEVVVFAPGFPLLPENGAEIHAGPGASDLWSLAREAVWRSAPDAELEFVVADRLVSIRGARPALPASVRWRVWASDPDAGDAVRWIESIRPAVAGTPRVTLAVSEAGGTRFERVRPEDLTESPAGVSLAPIGFFGESASASAHPLPAEPAIRVAIVEGPGREPDAAYLKAALETLAAELPIETEVRFPSPDELEVSSYGLVVWLSPEPVSDRARASVRAGGTVLADGGDLWEDCAGWVEVRSLRFETWRCSASPGSDSAALRALWSVDRPGGGGRALLAVQPTPERAELLFASRFRADWTGLVASPLFLEWLGDLVLASVPESSRAWVPADRSRIDPQVMAPATARAALPRQREADRRVMTLLWSLLVLTLLAERVVAYRSRAGRSGARA
ncbi:MAG: BatA domain-containing protein [Thermoanaerobaculia bacterium]